MISNIDDRRHGGAVELNGATIHYQERGEGTPVVLVHGGLGSSEEWHPIVAALTDDIRAITPDSRGHGRSTNPGGVLSYTQLADDVAALIAVLGLVRPVVGGWSDGGQALLELAVRHPGVAGALIVGGAYPEFVASGLREVHRELFCADDAGVPDVKQFDRELGGDAEVIKGLHPGGERQWQALVEQTAAMSIEYTGLTPDEVHAIDVPVLVLAGDRDQFIPLDLTMALYESLPNAELAICPAADHLAPLTEVRADLMASIIRDFTQRHRA